MALTLNPTAQVSVTLLDGTGNRAQVRAHLPSATTAANAQTRAAALAAAVQAISGCTVESYNITYSAVDTAAGDPNADSRVEDKGVFLFACANGSPTSYQVPGILESVLTSSGKINILNADVVAFIVEVSGGAYVGSQGSVVTILRALYQRFRRSTKGMLPSDRRVA